MYSNYKWAKLYLHFTRRAQLTNVELKLQTFRKKSLLLIIAFTITHMSPINCLFYVITLRIHAYSHIPDPWTLSLELCH